MRKLALLLLLPLALCGCGAKLPTPMSPSPPGSPLAGHAAYEASVTIRGGALEAAADIAQEVPDSCVLTFTAPESLAGMTYVFRSDGVDVRYRELAFQYDPAAVPQAAPAKVLVGAVSEAMKGDRVEVQETESGYLLTGTLAAGPFVLTTNRADGLPVKLSVPDRELEIEFVKFRFLD